MHEVNWTPSLVEERLAGAASVLKCLPDDRRRGYARTRWPDIVAERVGQEPKPMRALPSPAAISRMEETLTWTVGLDPIDGKIIWLRAFGERWKRICGTVGLERTAAHEHWLYALCVIAFRLSGRRLKRSCSKRKVIELARAAQR